MKQHEVGLFLHFTKAVFITLATKKYISKFNFDQFSFQVVSSSNVGYSWLCTLNGGLNYQVTF
jgi:hypothetical protein